MQKYLSIIVFLRKEIETHNDKQYIFISIYFDEIIIDFIAKMHNLTMLVFRDYWSCKSGGLSHIDNWIMKVGFVPH